MVPINHQFLDKDFYVPSWEIKFLFIGTFNPKGGKQIKYFYGREENNTWKILSNLFKVNFKTEDPDFFNLIKKFNIGCMDMISSVLVPTNKVQFVTGKGYADKEIINETTKRIYNTKAILSVIQRNPSVTVFSTWGKDKSLKEWKTEIQKIPNIIPLFSPSRAARVPKGTRKFEYVLNNWQERILPHQT